ncbi:helix-turn-helix domain-containing protein [Robertkochia sediminum]|uniref:helix-turn-helix domain-containing protein n=1 Tax=Robertkochia sediminum TaxID=2785326 RepID=UPI001931F42C|nr:helix-turn-helix domain-containing protein [Robertkochia sediminum]MBL7472035.1 helix-turn-helix transcriptional regulator [Robertkochia sediminum]
MGVLNTLQIIAAFNFFLIGSLILLNKKVVTYSVKLLGVFLVAKGITLFTNLVYIMQWPVPRALVLILSSALFVYAPFLYFFARYLVHRTVVDLRKDWLHFIPFGAYLLFNLIQAVAPFQSMVADYVITASYYLQAVTYTLFAFRLMHNKGDNSKSHYWLKNLLLSFLVVWFMFLFEVVFGLAGNADMALLFKTLGVLSILILANLTLVIAIYSPELFFKGLRVIKKANVENAIVTEGNYNRMLSLIAEKALYTDPQLKLADLANAMGLSERNTSLIIKTFHKGNFPDFLNSFRIEEAKRLFVEKQDELTISEVLYDVGFNSKSVFNTLFKKKVGMTPTQFKKSHAERYSAS